MSPRQRIYFFRDLWPAACRLQGWDETDRAKRLEVLSEILGRQIDSISDVDTTAEFDQVKARLLFLAENLDGAIEDGHPEIGEARRLRHVIREAIPAAYLAKIMRSQHPGKTLEDLDPGSLRRMLYTASSRAVLHKKRLDAQPATPAAVARELESANPESAIRNPQSEEVECPF